MAVYYKKHNTSNACNANSLTYLSVKASAILLWDVFKISHKHSAFYLPVVVLYASIKQINFNQVTFICGKTISQ